MSETKDVNLEEVKKLSEKVVTKIFTDRKNNYTIFKSFDRDNDGFVSHKDFVDKVKSMEVEGVTDKNALALAKHLDPDGNGFIEF